MNKSKTLRNLYRKQLQKAVERIKAGYQPQKIILFGSAARDDFREGSDIDLFIVKKTNRRFVDRVGDVLELIGDVEVPVEPIVYTPAEYQNAKRENRVFVEEVSRTGRILYG